MLSQEHRLIAISTPLGDSELVLYKAEITEALGQPFLITAELLSENDHIALDDLMGQNATISLSISAQEPRYFNGFITQFKQLPSKDGFSRYSTCIRPWLWLLNLSENCRIFQKKSYPDILTQVFNELGFDDFELQLSNNYPVQDYIVQFNESDFNFVARIMEQEGMFYYFEHADGQHTMIIVDDSANLPDLGAIKYQPPETDDKKFNADVITRWQNNKNIKTGGIRLIDFDFKVPTKNLESFTSQPTTDSLAAIEKFNYPGKYKERANGNQYTRLLMERENSTYETKNAVSNLPNLYAGAQFSLKNHYRDDQNHSHLITKLTYRLHSDHYLTHNQMEQSELCLCQFSAIDVNTPFRPQRHAKKPKMIGPQTAMVVGPEGEEIWTDEYGRVKVLFHWDRIAQGDEESSCWIRVAQTWAGKNWGHIQIPRIGQEVLIDFLAGDPDNPIIIGSVYNGTTMPPYDLPTNASQSGLKTRSTKGGNGANYNEIRFEDKKGSEEVYFHAEKDQNTVVENNRGQSIGNDHTEDIGHDKTMTIGNNHTETIGVDMAVDVGNNHTEKIGNNRNDTVGNDTNLQVMNSHTESIGNNMTIDVGSNLTESVTINYMENVGAAMELNVGAAMSVTVGAIQSINVGLNQSLDVGKNQTINIGNNRTITTAKDDSLKVGKNLLIDAGDSITIKCGKASIAMKKNGDITVQGKDLTFKASGKTDIKASKNITIKGKKVLAN